MFTDETGSTEATATVTETATATETVAETPAETTTSSGRGKFTPREFTFVGVDGKTYTWKGRGRRSDELVKVLEAEALATPKVTTTIDALNAHRKVKPSGKSVGRPRKDASGDKSAIAAMATETVALAAASSAAGADSTVGV